MYIPLHIVDDKSKSVLVNDQWTSLQFQQFISDEFNISIDDQIIYFKGKPLFGNVSGNLKDNGVKKGDNIFISKKIRGGSSAKGISIAMIIMTILILLLFVFTMFMGIIPVWAHVFGCYVKKGVYALLGKNQSSILKLIIKYVMYFFSFFVVAIFIYTLTGISFFMLLFVRKQHFCSSVVIAKYIALTLTAIFCVIYTLFSIPDFIGQSLLTVQNESPIFLGAILTPFVSLFEWISDKGKFMIFYFVPFLGSILLSEQQIVSSSVQFLYTFVDEMKQYSCQNDNFYISLISLLEYFETVSGCEVVKEHNLKRVIELIFYAFEDKIREITKNGKSDLKNIAGSNNHQQRELAKKFSNKLNELNKMKNPKKFKKSSARKSDQHGDDICKVYSTLLEYSKNKWNNYDYKNNKWNDGDQADQAKKKYEENPYPLDPVTRLALPISKNLLCSVFQLFPAVNDILQECIGREYVMVNMIENGQVAGCLTTIATLVIIILVFVKSSLYGYDM